MLPWVELSAGFYFKILLTLNRDQQELEKQSVRLLDRTWRIIRQNSGAKLLLLFLVETAAVQLLIHDTNEHVEKADLDLAVNGIAFASFIASGQVNLQRRLQHLLAY